VLLLFLLQLLSMLPRASIVIYLLRVSQSAGGNNGLMTKSTVRSFFNKPN